MPVLGPQAPSYRIFTLMESRTCIGTYIFSNISKHSLLLLQQLHGLMIQQSDALLAGMAAGNVASRHV